MVEYILIAPFVAVFIAFCACLWGLAANDMTLRRRIKIIWSMRVSDHEAFDVVSYDAHLWRVFTFRDPMKLYPAHFKDYI